MMKLECRKCPYFDNDIPMDIKTMGPGPMIVGHCKLRQKYVDKETIRNEFCKDKAVRELNTPATHPHAQEEKNTTKMYGETLVTF